MRLFSGSEIMAGRRPKPTALKLVAGNPGKRAINKKEPKPKRVIPSCPEHLSDSAQVAWGRLTVLLDRMGVLTEADGVALERLCDCYADILESRKLIRQDGRTYKVTTQTGEILIKGNPAVNQLRAADAQFKSYLVEFGLTPAARSKVQATPDDDEKADPLAEFFG
jgi:P27 family predicted phage terminase small subunit